MWKWESSLVETLTFQSNRKNGMARKSYRTSEKEESADPWEAEVYNSQEKFTEAYLKAGMHERVKGHVAP
jgi:hypothetical protein